MSRRLCPAFLCLALLAMVYGAGAGEPPEPAVVRLASAPVADGVPLPPLLCWPETWQTPRPVRFHLLRVDLRQPTCEVFALMGDDPDGDGPAEATLESPLALAARQHAVAAVNANAFRHLPTASAAERQRGWFAGKQVDVAGLVAVDGVARSLPDGPLASVWFDAKGRPSLGALADVAQARQGVSSWIDRLLTDGQVVARPDTQLHPRTLLGVDAEARVLLLVVADGRQKGYSEGISLPEAAEFMKAHGCHQATNLDGGGSSIMLVRDGATEATLSLVNRPSGGRPRPIPVMLGVRLRADPR